VLPIVATALLAIGAVVGGCGSDSASTTAPAASGSRPATASQATTPVGAPGSVSAGAGSTVPLGISLAQLEARLGKPAVPLHTFNDGLHCSLYRISEEPPFVKLRYCFESGQLKFFSTYAIKGSSG
jgi:hypothetical protein